MTILVDDAGWGDLLGSVVVACYREETQQFAYRLIDVRFFQEPLFDAKAYLKEAASSVMDMVLNDFKAADDEQIMVCTGYVLSGAVTVLRVHGYHPVLGKITGPLQHLGEKAFLDELRKLGYEPISDREASSRMRAKSFRHMLSWMNERPERRQFAKTGWGFFTGRPRRRWRGRDYDS